MLFSEVYGTYYNVIAQLLNKAVDGELTQQTMGASTDYNTITKLLDDCAATNIDMLCKIFLLMPTAYVDRRSPSDPLRATINTSYDVLQTGVKAEPFLRPSQNIILPVPDPLANMLDEYVKDRIGNLLALGPPESEISKYPISPSASDPYEPIRTRRINEYCAELIKKLDMPEIGIYNPDDIGSDIGKYHKDLFLSNWEHHATHTMKLDTDTISYVSGRTPETVVGTNYRDFTHPLQLEALSVECEKLIAKVELPDCCAEPSIILRKWRMESLMDFC